MNDAGGTVAILVRRFPKLSETFILGEIASLVAGGTNVRIISLHPPTENLQQPDAAGLLNLVDYVDQSPGLRGLLPMLRFATASLARFPRLIRQLRQGGATLWQLFSVHEICAMHSVRHLHAHYISEPAALADLVSQLRGHTFSISAHAKDIYLTSPGVIRERLAHAAFITTCTAHNQQHLLGLADARVHLLYHGVDSNRFKPQDEQSATATPLLVAVGRYKRKKGFDLLIEACAKLLADGIPIRCEIIGYGDQEAHLRRLIADSSLGETVALRPPVSHEQLASILGGASVCVLPCRQTEDGDRDGIPNALLEAMSCEVAVVSTAVSGIPEVIRSGKNGLLVEPENALALAEAIEKLISDPRLRRELGKRGRETVTDMFSWETNVAVLLSLLSSAVATSSVTPR